jgi:glycogen(starch) synthase
VIAALSDIVDRAILRGKASMKIAICATTFPPHLGGLENIAEMIADALGRGGDEVTVLTRSPGPAMPHRAYNLIREPGFVESYRVYRDSDAAVMFNVGVKMAPPLLAAGTPFAIWHQSEIGLRPEYSWLQAKQGVKHWLAGHKTALNMACSDFVARALPSGRPSVTLANPYDTHKMFEDDGIARDREVLFVGRLVSDKGVAVILDALAIPGGPLARTHFSIVGSGPEQPLLEVQVAALGLRERVTFLGAHSGAELRRLMNAHRVLVVPSRWEEPFGIVALEGLACGCATVVSRAGGLPEAIGAQGYSFENGNPRDAATVIAQALADDCNRHSPGRQAHLAAHSAATVAAKLHDLLQTRVANIATLHPKRGR